MKRIKKTVSTLARLAVGIAIIVYLFHKIDTPELTSVLSGTLQYWRWLAQAALLFLACLTIGAIRWKLILEAQGLRISWTRSLCIYFIGHFFNSFMFGATGGDVARAYYAAKETHHKKTEAVATVIIDRVIGMLALFLVAGTMLIARASFYLARPETRIAALLMLMMIFAGMMGLVIILNIHRFMEFSLFRKIGNHRGIGPAVTRTAGAFDMYRRRKATLAWTGLLSVGNHVFITVMCYCLGRSLQIQLGLIDYLTVIPVIMSLAAIPITPGGLGVREGLAVTLLGAMGVSSAQALPLSLMVYALALAWSVAGGIVFLCYSASAGHTLHDEMAELRKEAARENGETGVAGSEK